jgi:hypothetical protein
MSWVQIATADEYCQRWLQRRSTWRHTSEGGFDPRRYRVLPLDEATARTFVTTHHYAASWPAAVHRYGLLEAGHLVGVAVYAVPMSAKVLTGPLPTLTPYRQSLELARLVLLDHVPANAESWLLARTFGDLRVAGIRGIVTFADPMARLDHRGALIKRGHVGIIYQAGGAAYCGRGTPRTLTVLPDGTMLPARAAQKVRAGERGAEGVRRRLIGLGADPEPGGGADWLASALAQVGAQQVRHPGNHRYVYRLTRGIPLGLPESPYPKPHLPTAGHHDPLAGDPVAGDPLNLAAAPDEAAPTPDRTLT